jgi:hypothetical protein
VRFDNTPGCSSTTERTWSRNKKWSANSQYVCIPVMPGWLTHVEGRGLAAPGGLLTTHLKLIHKEGRFDVYEASWVRQGRGVNIYSESGMMVVDTINGFEMSAGNRVYHTTTAKSATAAIAAYRRHNSREAITDEQRSERQRRRQASRQVAFTKLYDKIARWDIDDIKDVEVIRGDSLKAGNCVPGTDQFIERFFPGATHTTIGAIIQAVGKFAPPNMSDSDLEFARRITASCLVAIRRSKTHRRTLVCS